MAARLRTTITIAILCFIASNSAFAQYETVRPKIGLKLNGFYPSGSVLSKMSRFWMAPAMEYNLSFDHNDRPTQIISASFFSNDSTTARAKILPITYTVLKRLSGGENSGGFYFGGGAGIYLTTVEALDWNALKWEGNDKRLFGVNLVAGYDLNETWFAELKYDKCSKHNDPVLGKVNFDGFCLSIGTRLAY